MPAPNFTRFFADVQRLWEAGDRERAEQLFDRGVPFVMWTMQSIDHSVTAAKVELHRRGVIASARLRQPALTLDDIALGPAHAVPRSTTCGYWVIPIATGVRICR